MRNYKRKSDKYLSYTSEALTDAVKAVKEGKMGLKKACKVYGVKRTALQRRVQGKIAMDLFGGGHKTALPRHVEDEMAKCLRVLASWGLGLIKDELLDLVADYVKTCKIDTPFVEGRPGSDWYQGFLRRHPTLSLRKPEQLTSSRAKATKKEIVDQWFELLGKTLKELDIENKPAQIYNVDETGLPLDPSKLKVIAEKGAKNVFRIIGGSGRETITVQGCGSASGHVLPPYVVYSGKNLYKEWTMGGAQNARYTTSSNGWMEGDTFYDWLQNMFIPNIPDIRPVLLIFDGHASHVTFPLVQLAVRNNITILRLPSHTTHYLQPLDVGVYGPVKTAWEKILVRYARLNLGRALLKDEFPKLVKQLWDVAMKSDSLRSGFRSCGIVPFDPSVIPESRYEASAALKPQAGPPEQSQDRSASPSTSASGLSAPQTIHHVGEMEATDGKDGETLARPASASDDTPSTSSSTLARPASASDDTPSTSSSTPTPSPTPTTSSTLTSSSSTPSSTPAIKDFFAKHIQTNIQTSRPRKRPSERVRRLQYGESLTSAECLQRMEVEDKEKKRKESEKAKKQKERQTKKNQKQKKGRQEESVADEPKALVLSESENQSDDDEVEKCEVCGIIDDTTNSDQFIGCDLCPKWYCKTVYCSGIDLSSVVDISTVDFVCVHCQENM